MDLLPELAARAVFMELKNELDIICMALTCKRWNSTLNNIPNFTWTKGRCSCPWSTSTSSSTSSTNTIATTTTTATTTPAGQGRVYCARLDLVPSIDPATTRLLLDIKIPTPSGSLPASLTDLMMGFCFNFELSPGFLPPTLITLIFGNNFNRVINADVLPPSLQFLSFGYRYNQQLQRDALPNSLRTLTFGNNYCRDIPLGALPYRLETLTFGHSYDNIIAPLVLPETLHTLNFGYMFNQELIRDSLPLSLKTLVFGDCFDQMIMPGCLPLALTSLTFGSYFNRSLLPGVIDQSSTLETLTFGYCFDRPLLNLPSSITSLTLGFAFDQQHRSVKLPAGLKTLSVDSISQLTYLGPTQYLDTAKVRALPTSLSSSKYRWLLQSIKVKTLILKCHEGLAESIKYVKKVADLLPLVETYQQVVQYPPSSPALIHAEYRRLDNNNGLYIFRPGGNIIIDIDTLPNQDRLLFIHHPQQQQGCQRNITQSIKRLINKLVPSSSGGS
ncbi:hypothetical protein SAMD00019534_071850, partial [Acytostelium subglobosum LB1]|uniref:hypothetical protein n=1 Tax=Acytostelium subglobosum LB1 TaxID=1410327 RepID=UPI000644F32E